jgi:hypothetical protein
MPHLRPQSRPAAPAEQKRTNVKKLGVDRISLREYEPEFKGITEALFGGKDVESYTGRFLRANSGSASS